MGEKDDAFPESDYDTNRILFSGSGGMTDTNPKRICLNRDPKNPIDMVERASPLAPAAVPPESRTTTGRLHAGTRMARMQNITLTSAKCSGGSNNAQECYERNPWANGRRVDYKVSMIHAQFELPWRWINPHLKQSLQVENENGAGFMEIRPDEPWTYKTVPVALDPQCSHMDPFCWTTFDGTDIKQYVYWNPNKNHWCYTFETSKDMERAIHVFGMQRHGEESAEYEKTFTDTSDFTELPHPIYQITTVSMANIFARRTSVDDKGILQVDIGLTGRPIPHQGMKIEWFIPEFDNASDKAENRMLEAWWYNGEKWAKVPETVKIFVENPVNDAMYGDPTNWGWRFNPRWLKRWNLAKHDSYRGEPHHELLIRPVEPNFVDAIISKGMKRIRAIQDLTWKIAELQWNAFSAPANPAEIALNALNAIINELKKAISLQEYNKLKEIATKAVVQSTTTVKEAVAAEVAKRRGGSNEENARNEAIEMSKAAITTFSKEKAPIKDFLEKLINRTYIDIQDEIQERSRRIIGTVSRLPGETGIADESDWYLDLLRH